MVVFLVAALVAFAPLAHGDEPTESGCEVMSGLTAAQAGESRPASDSEAFPCSHSALRSELLTMAEKDQAVRGRINAEGETPGLLEEESRIDVRNTARMKLIVDEFGWPTRSMVGKDGAWATWLLAMHADHDTEFQRRCLDLMKAALKRDEVSAVHVAYLTDRVRTREGKPQVYGTQYGVIDGVRRYFPIEDLEHVEERRAEVGLPPLGKYRELPKSLVISLGRPRPTPAREIEQAAEAVGITARVDKIFERWDKPDSPGCALAVIKDGRLVYKRGYGMANLDHDVPITPSTVFNIASVSKQFTAAAIALLAQEGKLSLDDEVRKYIPELPDFGTPITLRHLIHHTSGLRSQTALLDLAGWRIGLDHVTEENVLGLVFRQRELNFRPGEKYEYSNTNYFLLAQIVTRVSGQSFREFTSANLFQPLGMKNSFFRTDRATVVKNLAYGYVPTKGDTFRLSMPTSDTVGHTGLLTTVEDLARWDQNFYDGRVGGSALIEQLHQPGKLNDGTVMADDAFGLIIATYRGRPIVEHGGSQAGYRAHLIRFPEQRFSIACLCNTTTLPGELVRRVADIYLAKELKDPTSDLTDGTTVELSEEELASKAGLYWNRENYWIRKIVLKEGKLRKFLTYGRWEMKPLSENRFRLVGRPRAEVRFEAATPGARPRLAERFGGTKFRFFEPVDPVTPTRTELGAYVGTYVSEEVEATYQVALQDDKLVLKRPRREAASLQPLLCDVFSMGYTIRFTRDSNNRVSAMLFNWYGVRNFRFTKQRP